MAVSEIQTNNLCINSSASINIIYPLTFSWHFTFKFDGITNIVFVNFVCYVDGKLQKYENLSGNRLWTGKLSGRNLTVFDPDHLTVIPRHRVN